MNAANENAFREGLKKIDELLGDLLKFLQNKNSQVVIKNKDFVACYTFAFNMSSQNEANAKRLHEYYEKNTNEYARYLYDQLQKIPEGDLKLLNEYIASWENSKIFIRWIQKIFNNLDKFFLKMMDKSLFYIGFQAFTTNCFTKQTNKIVNLILSLLDNERTGDIIPSEQIIKGIKCIYEMGCQKDVTVRKTGGDLGASQYVYESKIEMKYYTEEFEKKLIADTKRFYIQKSQEWLCLSVPEYTAQALLVLKEEEERCEKYYPSSKKIVIVTIEETIIVKHHKTLAGNENTGIMTMFNKDSKHELGEIYKLFNRAPETLTEILNRFGQFFETKGKDIINDPNITKEPLEFVNKMLDLKKKADDLVQNEFQANMIFQKKRDATFQLILNKFEKAPGYFAASLDYEFKKGFKGLEENEVDSKLNDIKNLIFCLSARDTFLKIYTKHLSSRLLNNTSVSNDYEKLMLEKMQKEWGHMVVLKIKSMLQDIELSRQINTMFEDYLKNARVKPLSFGFSVQVLTQGSWPENEITKIQVPDMLSEAKQEFEKFHAQKYHGKVLTWVMSLGDAEVGLNVGEKKFILVVTNFQLCILLLFNTNDSWTYEQIKSKVPITDSDLQASLQMLYMKYPILTKSGPNKVIKLDFKQIFDWNFNFFQEKILPEETFAFNNRFQCATKRIVCKPAKIVTNKKAEESNELERDILKEREFIIDSVIIRVMKSRRILEYNEIQTESKKLISMFTPDPLMIKKRIESLVEREYLRRDENEMTKFIYVP